VRHRARSAARGGVTAGRRANRRDAEAPAEQSPRRAVSGVAWPP
jgi:hypothetical protein